MAFLRIESWVVHLFSDLLFSQRFYSYCGHWSLFLACVELVFWQRFFWTPTPKINVVPPPPPLVFCRLTLCKAMLLLSLGKSLELSQIFLSMHLALGIRMAFRIPPYECVLLNAQFPKETLSCAFTPRPEAVWEDCNNLLQTVSILECFFEQLPTFQAGCVSRWNGDKCLVNSSESPLTNQSPGQNRCTQKLMSQVCSLPPQPGTGVPHLTTKLLSSWFLLSQGLVGQGQVIPPF